MRIEANPKETFWQGNRVKELSLVMKRNWDNIREECQELIVVEGWEAKFEAEYRKRQMEEWNYTLKTEKLCEDAVMALLLKFNEEITPEERTRRSSCPKQQQTM
jgi:hypothetical protein